MGMKIENCYICGNKPFRSFYYGIKNGFLDETGLNINFFSFEKRPNYVNLCENHFMSLGSVSCVPDHIPKKQVWNFLLNKLVKENKDEK
jgi:hypothetical protein